MIWLKEKRGRKFHCLIANGGIFSRVLRDALKLVDGETDFVDDCTEDDPREATNRGFLKAC